MIWALRERREFDELARRGVRTRTATLWCTSLLEPDATDPPRVAFAVSRAVGSAVTRNRVKRRLRAVTASAALRPGRYLIGVRPSIVERTFAEVRTEFTELLATTHRKTS